MSTADSNILFQKRNERLLKVSELLEKGVQLTSIAQQLDLTYDTVKKDVELVAAIGVGSLTPEICASKRVEIDKQLLNLVEETRNTYRNLLERGNYVVAAQYLRISLEIHKFLAKLWGVDTGVPIPTTLNFNRYDLHVPLTEVNKVRDVISRKDENMTQYYDGLD